MQAQRERQAATYQRNQRMAIRSGLERKCVHSESMIISLRIRRRELLGKSRSFLNTTHGSSSHGARQSSASARSFGWRCAKCNAFGANQTTGTADGAPAHTGKPEAVRELRTLLQRPERIRFL